MYRVYRRSRAADFRDETHRIGHVASRRRLFGGGVWFFNARATGRARVCMQSTGRIFRSCSAATAAWKHRREICIYQAGATNISFIICSERLICSPRRAASTCPPPVDPRRRPPRGPTLVVLFPSLFASSRVTRHSIPRSRVD